MSLWRSSLKLLPLPRCTLLFAGLEHNAFLISKHVIAKNAPCTMHMCMNVEMHMTHKHNINKTTPFILLHENQDSQ